MGHAGVLHSMRASCLFACVLSAVAFADQPALRRLQSDWKAKNYTLRELIHLIATSDLLRQP